MRFTLGDLLELIGVALLAVAAGAWDWRALLGLIASLMIIVGFVLDAGPDDAEP